MLASPPSLLAVGAAFAVALAALHIVLVRLYPQNAAFWRASDYVWLSVACLGLVAAVGAARVELRTLQAPAEARFLETDYRVLVASISPSPIFCRPFKRSPSSPPDFDQVQAEYELYCAWAQAVSESLPPFDPGDPASVYESGLPAAPDLSEPVLLEQLSYFREVLARYNLHRESFQQLLREQQPTQLETLLLLTYPYLLPLALALRITKVSGELALARRA